MKKREQKLHDIFDSLKRCVEALVVSANTPILEKRDLSGIIKDFELAYELAWKSLKAKLDYEGHETSSARNVFVKAFSLGIIADENIWLEMIDDRNLTVHAYDAAFAKKMCERIKKEYLPLFIKLTEIAKI